MMASVFPNLAVHRSTVCVPEPTRASWPNRLEILNKIKRWGNSPSTARPNERRRSPSRSKDDDSRDRAEEHRRAGRHPPIPTASANSQQTDSGDGEQHGTEHEPVHHRCPASSPEKQGKGRGESHIASTDTRTGREQAEQASDEHHASRAHAAPQPTDALGLAHYGNTNKHGTTSEQGHDQSIGQPVVHDVDHAQRDA